MCVCVIVNACTVNFENLMTKGYATVCVCVCVCVIVNACTVNFENLMTKGYDVIVIINRCHRTTDRCVRACQCV